VVDDNGSPVPSATVDIDITGLETTNLTTEPSDNNGMAEAKWKTLAPKGKGKKDRGSTTAAGTYRATVTNVTADGYTWDGNPKWAEFSIIE